MKKTLICSLRQTAMARRVMWLPRAATNVTTAATRQRCWLSTTNDLTVPPESRPATSKDGVAGRPIDFDIQSKIEGNESQIVTITLEPGQVLRAESGGRW